MAKTVQSTASAEDPVRIMTHLGEHLTNYAQYFRVEQRGPDLLSIRIREVVVKLWNLTKPGFLIRVTPSGTGARITLRRTLAPLWNWGFGLVAAGGLLLTAVALGLLFTHWSELKDRVPLVTVGIGVTVLGFGLRQAFYVVEAGRDREFTGILQKALADFGRPTAIRRREQSRGPGTPNP